MSDLLAKGAAMLARVRKAAVSRPVTYRRGTAAVALPATVGQSDHEQIDEHGIVLRIETRDYLVLAADLTFGAGPVQPQAGDRIDEPDGDGVRRYEVVAVGLDPPWRWSDRQRLTMRIHTHYIGSPT